MTQIGKTRGIARLADADGFFTMVALDQRPPLVNAIAKARGQATREVSFHDMLAAKRLLVEGLSHHASSMLLDPNFAVPAAIDILPARTGLIVTLEEHRFDDTAGGAHFAFHRQLECREDPQAGWGCRQSVGMVSP